MRACVHTPLRALTTMRDPARGLLRPMTIPDGRLSGNGLLARMPEDVRLRLSEALQPVDLALGKVLYEPNVHQHAMVFPRSGMVSLQYMLANGDGSEVAMVGNEGMVGVALLVDSHSTPTRAVVQAPGEALALRSETVDREFRRGGAFQFAILRYTQALLTQIAQVGVCNSHHAMEQRLCRWLLQMADRHPGDELHMTQERIARLLGVRREGVTEAASRLQEARILSYSRGTIRIVDRDALLARSCECYRVIREDYARLLAF